MPKTVASPRPVPFPSSLVVKNGSNMRAWVALSMPTPVSVTVSTTCGPGLTPIVLRGVRLVEHDLGRVEW